MKRYIGTKIIHAEPQVEHHAGEPREGYKVVYQDGYTSWSPKDVFEEAYRPAEGLTFGLAIEALKKGLKASRTGWNGKGMFVYLVGADSYPVKTEAAKSHFGPNSLVPYRAYIAMKTVDNDVVPWVASQTDMLAEDWSIVE